MAPLPKRTGEMESEVYPDLMLHVPLGHALTFVGRQRRCGGCGAPGILGHILGGDEGPLERVAVCVSCHQEALRTGELVVRLDAVETL